MKTFLRWAGALVREIWQEGAWVCAPPLVIPASSPFWRAAPPPRLAMVQTPAVETAPADPQLVAARRASLRLVLNEQKV